MTPTWFEILILAFVDIGLFLVLAKLVLAYFSEMESRNKEWED